ncbi:hypothetical protein [Streptomyces europaeiscabiei]|uniref:hypothetical protein n=1 Tax=Streptomyces europaeiscabiei TaxID=146819 RepID=UPI0029A7EE85|nr:hypothetical protein [Streptomyces europaeiscabiei]MDX3839404.1 hypothetical protein [Streptomyces europaeiscabiei]
MSDFDDLTEAELDRLTRAVVRAHHSRAIEKSRAADAFYGWLAAVGLGWVVATIKTTSWAWDGIRRIFRGIFG